MKKAEANMRMMDLESWGSISTFPMILIINIIGKSIVTIILFVAYSAFAIYSTWAGEIDMMGYSFEEQEIKAI